MKDKTNQQKPFETRPAFLKSTGALVDGLFLGGPAAACAGQEVPAGTETLALLGGPKAVTHPHGHAARWPHYAAEEEGEIVKLIRDPNHAPIEQLEKDWKEHFQDPCVRAYCNGPGAGPRLLADGREIARAPQLQRVTGNLL